MNNIPPSNPKITPVNSEIFIFKLYQKIIPTPNYDTLSSAEFYGLIKDKIIELRETLQPTEQLTFPPFYTLLTTRREYLNLKKLPPDVTATEQETFDGKVRLFKDWLNSNLEETKPIITTLSNNYCMLHCAEFGGEITNKTRYRMYCTLADPNNLLDNLVSLVTQLKSKTFTGQFKFSEKKQSLLTRRDAVVFYATSIDELVKAHKIVTDTFPKTQFDYGATVQSGEERLTYHQFLAMSLVRAANNTPTSPQTLDQLSNTVENLRYQVENAESDDPKPDPGLV